jgi:hypothetical protein
MAYDKISAEALSNNWRVYCLSLDVDTRQQMIASMLEATSVKNERNVRLWFDTSGGYRKILNKTLAADEYALREKIIKSCLRLNNENVPMKGASGTSSRRLNAVKFAEYVKDRYTGTFTRIISFNPSGFSISYDTYGIYADTIDDSIDEDYIEFTQEPLPDSFVFEFL